MEDKEFLLNADDLKAVQEHLGPTELQDLFRQIEAFHGINMYTVDITEKAREELIDVCDPHGYSLD